MTLNEYQQLAARTINYDNHLGEIEKHALHGMVGEIGEIHSLYQKVYQGHEFSDEEAEKELGDLLWMIAEYATVKGFDLEEVAQKNIDKLRKRYPDGFSVERSVHRGRYE